MNRTFTICIFMFIINWSLYCQNEETDKDLDQIRSWFKEINTNIDQFKQVELLYIEVFSDIISDKHSIEGTKIYRLANTNMTKYFDENVLIKIVVTFNGDREELVSEYYLRESSLYFVDKRKIIFHKPKWHDEFDESNKSVLKNRFYFNNNKLLRWINTDVESIGKMNPNFTKHESIILNDINLCIGIN